MGGREGSQQPRSGGFNILEEEKNLEDKVEDNTSELAKLTSKIANLCQLLQEEKKDHHEYRVQTMKIIENMQSDISTLKTTLAEQQETIKNQQTRIDQLEDKADNLEQRDRLPCLRMYNVVVDKEEEKQFGHSVATCKAAFRAIKPILENETVKMGLDIPVDQWYNIFRNGHKLYASKEVKNPPILVRVKNRDLKSLILSNKFRLMSETETELPTTQGGVQRRSNTKKKELDNKDRKSVFITQDLTKKRYTLLKSYIDSGLFKKVWLLDGTILKFIKKNDTQETIFTTKISNKTANELIKDHK